MSTFINNGIEFVLPGIFKAYPREWAVQFLEQGTIYFTNIEIFRRDEDAERGAIAHRAGDPYFALFQAGQEDGSIDPSLRPDVTYLALVTSMTGTNERLLVETTWTNGSDRRARGVHQALIAMWRQALSPKESQ